MKNNKLTGIIMIAVGAVLAIVGYMILPETLFVQFGIDDSVPGAPKLAALAIFFIMDAAGALGYMHNEEKKNLLFISGLGLFLIVLAFVINLPRVF